MQKVQINIYKGRGAKDIKTIEVPKGLKPGEVMVLAGKSLTPEENALLWDWQFIHNNTMTKEEFKQSSIFHCDEYKEIHYNDFIEDYKTIKN